MKKQLLFTKLRLSAACAVICNALIILLAMYWETISQNFILWSETAIFIALQMLVILIYVLKPLQTKAEKWTYWTVSEILTVITVGFWGFYLVGPIWLQ